MSVIAGRMHFVGPLERALFMKKVPLLAALAPPELAVMSEYGRERFVREGEVILERGESPQSVFIIVDGWIRVEGGEYPLGVDLGAEQAVGLVSFLARDPEGVHAVAEVDSLVLELSAELLRDLFEENFYFVLHVIKGLARRIMSERLRIPDGQHLGGTEPIAEIPPERPLNYVERLMVLARGSTLGSSLDSVSQLARLLVEHRLTAGTPMWKTGDRSGFIYAILSGRVRCVQPDGRGTFTCGPGYPLGNVESQCGEPRWYDAYADTDVVLNQGYIESFHDLLEDDFVMAVAYVAALAKGVINVRRESAPRG